MLPAILPPFYAVIFCTVISYPASSSVGVYSYQGSDGKRYSGTFNPGDQIPQIAHFSDEEPYFARFNDINSFFPDFFANYENILQQVFGSDVETQRLASQAALKAYDLTYNHIGYNPNFFRFPRFPQFPEFGPGAFGNMDQSPFQAAYAGAAIGPGFRRQIAAIDPINVNMPNVDITSRFNDEVQSDTNPNFYSVSSSSYASSSNVDGKVTGSRGAETVVNDNGKVTKYKVQN